MKYRKERRKQTIDILPWRPAFAYCCYNHLNLHVGCSNRTVLRECWQRLGTAAKTPAGFRARRAYFKAMLKEHKDARKLYVDVMSGNIG